MRILTADQMRAVDRRIIEELSLPGLVLMENAALGVVEALAELFPEAQRVAILCGPGNNGGDGLAVARHLLTRGVEIELFLAVEETALHGDAGSQLQFCRGLGMCLRSAVEEAEAAELLSVAATADVFVDALFGTGLTRPLEGRLARLVDGVNGLAVPCLAVDLPSGLDASRSDLIGPAVDATATVTFAAPKLAHVFAPAAELTGTVLVTDLGVPSTFVDEVEGERLFLLVAEELAAELRPRSANSHKGTYGHVLVVAGSRGKSGAASLTCRGALRAGAGLVTAAVPDRLVESVNGASTETMTEPLGPGGTERLDPGCWEDLSRSLDGKTVVAVGPGLGAERETCEVVRRLAAAVTVPVVIDADGLNAFAPEHGGRLEELADRQAPTILTPHPGELGRLLARSAAEVQSTRREAAATAARRAGAIVVLKGHQTLVATPEGAVFVNSTGNAGMATAGSGDVLTGVLAGLVAQGYEPRTAACLGVFLHGLAGDEAARRDGEECLVAGDVLESLPAAFRRLRDEGQAG